VAIRHDDYEPEPEVVELVGRPVVCHRAHCPELAGADGLCEHHHRQQVELRVLVVEPPRAPVPLPRLPVSRPTWHELAACRGMGPDLFYPPASAPRGAAGDSHADARKVCSTCPVIDQCRRAGEAEAHGIWAGTTPAQRRHVRQP